MNTNNINTKTIVTCAAFIIAGYTIVHRDTMHLTIANSHNAINNKAKLIESPLKVSDTTVAFEVKSSTMHKNDPLKPKTELGRKLLELRNKAIKAGMPLLSFDEINTYMNELRGELN